MTNYYETTIKFIRRHPVTGKIEQTERRGKSYLPEGKPLEELEDERLGRAVRSEGSAWITLVSLESEPCEKPEF